LPLSLAASDFIGERSASGGGEAAQRHARRLGVWRTGARDEALKVLLQNLLDSLLIAFNWEISRCWLVRVD
jgi:hypothetical protein